MGNFSAGELFVLKMGTPIKIASMARDLITLSGLTPDVDIEVTYTGLRPGEKLYEELITEGEGIQPTRHQDIMVLKAYECPDIDHLEAQIGELVRLAQSQDIRGIKQKLSEIVPEYQPQFDKPAATGSVAPAASRADRIAAADNFHKNEWQVAN